MLENLSATPMGVPLIIQKDHGGNHETYPMRKKEKIRRKDK